MRGTMADEGRIAALEARLLAADGGRIKERFNRTLDGSPQSHEAMRKLLEL